MFQQILENLTRRQKVIVGVFLGLFVLIIVVIVIFANTTRAPKAGDVITKVDKNSGDKSTTIVGENESFFDAKDEKPLVYGLSALINLGMTVNQTNALQNSVLQYSKVNSLGIKKASITVKEIKVTAADFRSADQITIVTSPLLIDDKQKISMKLQYRSSTDLEVIFSDGAGKLLYDSGTISL